MSDDGFGNRKDASSGVSRRKDPRVSGPFEGRRVDFISTPLTIHDLSRSGCLVQWFHEQTPGRRFTMEMNLPNVGWLQVDAESVYNRSDYGFAVRFVDVPAETLALLDEAIAELFQNPSRRL
jgi:hypothetical protein